MVQILKENIFSSCFINTWHLFQKVFFTQLHIYNSVYIYKQLVMTKFKWHKKQQNFSGAT